MIDDTENDVFQMTQYNSFIKEIEPKLPNTFEISCYIGGGAIGTIFAAKSNQYNLNIAVKMVKSGRNVKLAQGVYKECKLQADLKHENIIKVLGSAFTTNYSCIFMELLTGGDLFDSIPIGEGINIQRGVLIYSQILNALDYCHQRKIVHLDIKPENIMISVSGKAKLIDFGLAIDHNAIPFLEEQIGTYAYAAPETFMKCPYTGYKADIFSLNVTLLTCVTGERCWERAVKEDCFYNEWCQMKLYNKTPLQFLTRIPTDMLLFLKSTLAHSVDERLNINQIRCHVWFRNALKNQVNGIDRPMKHCQNPCSQPIAANNDISNSQLASEFQESMQLSQPEKPTLLPMPENVGSESMIVRRMTRFFSNMDIYKTLIHIRAIVEQHRYCSIIRINGNNIMVESNFSGFKVTFRIFVYKFTDSVLVDFRRVRGDGLLFHTVYRDMLSTARQLTLVHDSHPYLTALIPNN